MAPILISFLGIIIYSNSFLGPFQFDDIPSIVNNPFIRDIHHLQNVLGFLPRRSALYFTFAFNYHFNGLNVFGYHLFNLGIHLASALLLWKLVLLTFSTPVMKDEKISCHADVISLLAGLVFVAHPVQTQAVTYIVQRAASMAALFYLASLVFYVKSKLLQTDKAGLSLAKFYYICSLLTAIMAMFTKETAITLPLMILLYEFSFLKTGKNIDWRRLFPFLLTICIIPLTMLLTESGPARLQQLRNEPGISPIHYLLTQFRVMVTYIRLAFFPFHQNLDYDYPILKNILQLPVLTSLLFLTSILLFAKCLFSKYRLVSFSIFWFFLALLPESSFLPIKDVIYEHRLYLPLAGYSIFIASSSYYLLGRNNFRAMTIAVTLVIACYSVLTYQRNEIWKDELTLWDDAVKKSPHKARPYNNRGNILAQQGNFAEAMLDFNKAIAIDPNYANAYYNRGITYTKEGYLTQAVFDYNKAININPEYAKAYNNRGNIYYTQNRFIRAISDYGKAITLNPTLAEAYNDRGNAYCKQGDFIQAISDYNKAIALNPELTAAHNNLIFTYFQLNKGRHSLGSELKK
jgi:Tfp pilus assembly protein PilF